MQQPLASTLAPERERIRVRATARWFGVSPAYISMIAAPGGLLERAGVTVIRYPTLPDVVEFYVDEVAAWWKARHPEWDDAIASLSAT